jgi:hypothetical protein
MNRLDYLAKTFSNNHTHKIYENYVVNAIWNRIGNPNLKPVTQQYVLRNDESGKHYALIDLYFPDLNIGIECDEGYHKECYFQYRL